MRKPVRRTPGDADFANSPGLGQTARTSQGEYDFQ
jgi:hypothetical protein